MNEIDILIQQQSSVPMVLRCVLHQNPISSCLTLGSDRAAISICFMFFCHSKMKRGLKTSTGKQNDTTTVDSKCELVCEGCNFRIGEWISHQCHPHKYCFSIYFYCSKDKRQRTPQATLSSNSSTQTMFRDYMDVN